MVKVLDNRLVDLDLLPGAKPADLQAQAEKLQNAQPEKAEALRQLAQDRASVIAAETSKQTGLLGNKQGDASTGVEEGPGTNEEGQGGFVGGAKNVGTELVGTVGGLGKGVGNTLGNTVYDLGSTLGGAAGGLGKTGKAAVGMSGEAKGAQSESVPDAAKAEDQTPNDDNDEEQKTESVSVIDPESRS